MRRDASLSHSNGGERQREKGSRLSLGDSESGKRVESTDGDGEMKMEMERATDFSV